MKSRVWPLLTLIALAAALVADARWPSERRAHADVEPTIAGGVLACPVATLGGGGGTVDVANFGERSASIRVNWFPRGRPAGERLFTLRARTARSVRLSGGARAATVAYVGTYVVASHSAVARGHAVAGTCQRPGPATLAVAGLRTLEATSTLSVFNPGLAAAEVSVTLLADGRRLRTEGLTDRRVDPRERRDFDLGAAAFDTRQLTAVVTASKGRVAVEGIVDSDNGLAVIGATRPSSSIVASTIRRTSDPEISAGAFVTAIGSREAPLDGRLITERGQGSIPGAPTELAPGAGASLAIPPAGRVAGFALSSEVGSLAGASRWVVRGSRGSDVAGLEAIETAPRWGGVIGRPTPGAAYAVFVNPGPDPAPIQLRTLGAGGKVVPLLLQPGRVHREFLGSGAGPLAMEVRAERPVAVFLDATSIGRKLASSIALPATPLTSPVQVPVGSDARAGIPVRIRDLDD